MASSKEKRDNESYNLTILISICTIAIKINAMTPISKMQNPTKHASKVISIVSITLLFSPIYEMNGHYTP